MGDVGLAIQRAEDKTAQMQARAGAIDELLASGALDDPTGTAKDDITLELEQLASTSDVESELARMKAVARRRTGRGSAGHRGPAGGPGRAAADPGLPGPGRPADLPGAPGEYEAPPTQQQPTQPRRPSQGDLR